MRLRDIKSERGAASRLFEQKCDKQYFNSIFASFGLPELNFIALANKAVVSVIAQYLRWTEW
jgi:hypothetical protein